MLPCTSAARPRSTPTATPTADTSPTLRCWPAKDRPAYLEYERDLLAVPNRDHLLAAHQSLASEPHIAGTDGDARVIETLAKTLREIGEGVMGWTVEVDDFYAYLPSPVEAQLEIVGPDRKTLELRERPLAADPAADQAIGPFAWLGYSGSGEVTGQVVYANYGTKADFATLRRLGVDLTGKIALCRYGGNYRGYKVKFAQEAGAAGVLIYTDPADAGFTKGPVYPQGGWANDCCIQRGSLLVAGYGGDPLTPGWAATKDAKRLDPKDAPLPRIPAQPIGYGAAGEILARMTGRERPADLKDWAGGLKADYRLDGGPDRRGAAGRAPPAGACAARRAAAADGRAFLCRHGVVAGVGQPHQGEGTDRWWRARAGRVPDFVQIIEQSGRSVRLTPPVDAKRARRVASALEVDRWSISRTAPASSA